MKKLFIVALFVVASFVSVARADIAPDKRAEIQKLLRLTGMEKLMNQMKVQMIDTFKAQSTGVPDEFWAKAEKEMDVRELIELIIPVYDKYYTLDDLKAVNAFYESPSGQKILSTLPQVSKESGDIGRAWGEKIGRQIEQEIQQAQAKKPTT